MALRWGAASRLASALPCFRLPCGGRPSSGCMSPTHPLRRRIRRHCATRFDGGTPRLARATLARRSTRNSLSPTPSPMTISTIRIYRDRRQPHFLVGPPPRSELSPAGGELADMGLRPQGKRLRFRGAGTCPRSACRASSCDASGTPEQRLAERETAKARFSVGLAWVLHLRARGACEAASDAFRLRVVRPIRVGLGDFAYGEGFELRLRAIPRRLEAFGEGANRSRSATVALTWH